LSVQIINYRYAVRQRVLIAILLASLAGGTLLMLHLIAASDRPSVATDDGSRRSTVEEDGRAPAGGLRASWLAVAVYLVLAGTFVVICCRGAGCRADAPLATTPGRCSDIRQDGNR